MQKAVVVLATEPIFGPVREKLAMVTRAYFAQRDLTNLGILDDFFTTIEPGLQGYSDASLAQGTRDELSLYMGTSRQPREC